MTRARSWLARLPGLGAAFRSLRLLKDAARSPFLRYAPPGHYYSCIPDMKDVMARAEVLFRRDVKACPGVDLREREQIQLLERLADYYQEQPFREGRTGKSRYYYPNGFFGIGDAIVLYALFRHFRPKRVIEIGSGFSSAAMLDTSEGDQVTGIEKAAGLIAGQAVLLDADRSPSSYRGACHAQRP